MKSHFARRLLAMAGVVTLIAALAACAPLPPPGPGGYPGGPPPMEESGPVRPPPPGVTSFATTGNLNIRSGPSITAAVIGVIPVGGLVITMGDYSNNWWQVNWNNTVGWVYGRYLRPQ
jgi:hypothetical protein